MMRLAFVSIVLAGVSCASPMNRPWHGAFTPIEEPRQAAGDPVLDGLASELGAEDPGCREAASSKLRELLQDPARQVATVDTLRRAATSSDPEIRNQAGALLRDAGLRESRVPGDRHAAFAFTGGGSRTEASFRLMAFADGSHEVDVRLVIEGAAEQELFSGRTPAEVCDKIRAAARSRGFGPEVFDITPDAKIRVAGSSITLSDAFPPDPPILRDWGVWIRRIGEDDAQVPASLHGGWVVLARTVEGSAFRRGILPGDVLKPASGALADLPSVRSAAERGDLRVFRPRAVERAWGDPPPADATTRPGPVPFRMGPTMFILDGERRTFLFDSRLHLDGRLELDVTENGDPWPSVAAPVEEMAREFNRVAGRRGSGLSLRPDGTGTWGGAGIGVLPLESMMDSWTRDWAAWLEPLQADSRVLPAGLPDVRVVARLDPSGPGARGLAVGDLLPDAGRKPAELRQAVEDRTVRIVRLRYDPVELR